MKSVSVRWRRRVRTGAVCLFIRDCLWWWARRRERKAWKRLVSGPADGEPKPRQLRCREAGSVDVLFSLFFSKTLEVVPLQTVGAAQEIKDWQIKSRQLRSCTVAITTTLLRQQVTTGLLVAVISDQVATAAVNSLQQIRDILQEEEEEQHRVIHFDRGNQVTT